MCDKERTIDEHAHTMAGPGEFVCHHAMARSGLYKIRPPHACTYLIGVGNLLVRVFAFFRSLPGCVDVLDAGFAPRIMSAFGFMEVEVRQRLLPATLGTRFLLQVDQQNRSACSYQCTYHSDICLATQRSDVGGKKHGM